MKKIYTLFVAGLVGGSMIAQQSAIPSQTAPLGKAKLTPAQAAQAAGFSARKNAELKNKKTTTVYEMMSPHDAVTTGPHSGNFTTYVDPVFVDSTVTTNFGSGATYVGSMKQGGVFDATSTNYSAGNPVVNPISAFQAYTIDTVWIAGYYNIKTGGATPGDTLVCELSYGPKASAWYQALTISSTTPAEKWNMPMNVASLAAGDACHDKAPSTNKMVLKRLLTAADTVSVGNPNFPYIAIAANLNVPAGDIVGIQYTFSPKAAYSAGASYYTAPTNTATMNSFLALLDEQTGLTSTNGNNWFYDASSDGTSGVLDIKGRYGIWPAAQSFLDGVMLPYTNDGYLWTMSVSYVPSGINELSNNGLTLSQNTPNPFGTVSAVNYELAKESNVTFTVYDVTGRVVMNNALGNVATGAHTVNLNAADFGKGVYFYSITANGTTLSRKMVITE